MRELGDLDLNLLKILQAIVETHNTHLAADKLGISQTSVSRGLTKLKQTFGEQLFIRKAHGVEPSELAEKLAEAASEMLTPFIKVVESYQDFDPLKFNGEIHISMNIFILELYGEKISASLRKSLPNASFKMTYWQEQSMSEMLNGQIDYMIQLSGFPIPQDIYQHSLTNVGLSLIARNNHPVLSQSSEWDKIHELPLTRILIDGINAKRTVIEDLYASKGYTANIALSTHSISTLLGKLKESDSISFGSQIMVESDSELDSYPLPRMPKEMRSIQLDGGYLQSKRGFPLNQHLHQVIQNCFDALD
jgi:DNA-binding transcriptional LysR family regulator